MAVFIFSTSGADFPIKMLHTEWQKTSRHCLMEFKLSDYIYSFSNIGIFIAVVLG